MFSSLFSRLRNARGILVILALGVAVVWSAIAGPQGLRSLLEKRAEIRELEEFNEKLEEENEVYRRRILRLEQSPNEQEIEIRKQLKLLKPGETTFFLPQDSGNSAEEVEADPGN